VPDLSLELTAVLGRLPERLFTSFVRSGELARWWGPHGFSTPEVELDARPGGRYRFTMQPPDGDAFHVTGEFLEVDPPRRLSFTFAYEEPAPDDRETVVVLDLRSTGDGTEISLTQGPFATEERRDLHRAGWTESFERLRDATEA
jgi:uncharacterized protein YndB with AHSA1/START domain